MARRQLLLFLPPTPPPPSSHPQGGLPCAASVLRRCTGALCGWEDLCGPGWGRGRRLTGAGRGAAGLDLRLELSHLFGAGQVLEQVVLLLQLSVALDQLFDLLLQHLHLLPHGVHQVALHQVLRMEERDEKEREMVRYNSSDAFFRVSSVRQTSCSNHKSVSR